jgi:hypothetical protein
MLSPAQLLHSAGYIEFLETDPTATTMQVAREVSGIIGAEVADFSESLVATPKGVKPLNTYGGNYGHGPLPLHTDLAHWYRPPRYVLLRCISGTKSVATQLLNRRQLEAWIPPSLMRRALFSPRRRLEGKLFLLRMLTEECFRWDQLFLKPQNTAAHEVTERMQEITLKLPAESVVLAHVGQTLLIDNWSTLHGRSAVPATESGRMIDRIYLETGPNGNKNSP